MNVRDVEAAQPNVPAGALPIVPKQPAHLPQVRLRTHEGLMVEAELIELTQSRYAEGSPVVLVKPRQSEQCKAKQQSWILSNTYLQECYTRSVRPFQEDMNVLDFIGEMAVLHGPKDTLFSPIDLADFASKDDSGKLREIFLDLNDFERRTARTSSNQAFLAAVLATGMLGFENPLMADFILEKIAVEERVLALTGALIDAVPHHLSLADQLLAWGALPDGEGPTETLSPLEVAILLADPPAVRFFLEKTLALGLDHHRMDYLLRRASCDAAPEVHREVSDFAQNFFQNT